MMEIIAYGETFIFIVLFIASIVALGVCIERFLYLRPHYDKSSRDDFLRMLEMLRSKGAGSRGMNFDAETIYSRFAEYCIGQMKTRKGGMENIMKSKMLEEESALEKRLSVLSTLGNNAPFIGLLGTVLGVITAFHGLGTLGNTGAEVVMRSISRALVATAAGLLIAVPVVIFNNYFSSKIRNIIKNLEILSQELNALVIKKGK